MKHSTKQRQTINKLLYKDYIKSNAWKEKRKMVLKYYKTCCRCDSTNNLCVHHGSYRRVSEELPSDLYVLCKSCHKEFHERFPLQENMKRKTRKFIRELNPDFHQRNCMPMDQVNNRISKHHCKYCNADLMIKKTRNKLKGKATYYYCKTWQCSKRCTHGVTYLFPEDIRYE